MGALLISPVLQLTDSAIVGHWTTDALAGLSLAQTISSTIVGLCIFLAYSTTAEVSRSIGSGDRRRALSAGMNAIWLAIALGCAGAALTALAADLVIGFFDASPQVHTQAVAYLQIVSLGLPGILVSQATTGVLRGLQDTRTPLIVTGIGALVNAPASLALVHLASWGIRGAAVGTVVCELGIGATLMVRVIAIARREQVECSPYLAGISQAWSSGLPLLIRTMSLRAALIALSAAAVHLGTAQLAAHQIVWNLWNLMANILDSFAIAGQTLTGTFLGAGNRQAVREATRRMMWWGIIAGTVCAVLVWVLSALTPSLFSPDPAVQSGIRIALFVVVFTQPIAGFAFVVDGVLMGAGDTVFLAWLMLGNLIVFLPPLWLAVVLGPGGDHGLAWLWIIWCLWFMGVRSVGLWLRARTDAWMRIGV